LLIKSLDEAERLYRAASTPFELEEQHGHLRSFSNNCTCRRAQRLTRNSVDLNPEMGRDLLYLRDHGVLTVKEEQFAAKFYALMSDTAVHLLLQSANTRG